MSIDTWSWRSPWRWLWLAPWAMLAINLLSWLTLGSDLPFVDDWRAYADGTAGRWLPAHWFTAINNTMAPVGLALDALAQRGLAGNVLAYQFISQLLVQGSLLVCQWRLLRWALPDGRLAVLAFAATAFMLQAGSYWGEQNLAYHQALPLVWLLAALCVGLTSTLRPALAGAWGVLLGTLAGLSYISGAVAAGVLGAACLALLVASKPLADVDGRRARATALGVLLAGVATTALQVWASRVLPNDVQGQAIPTALPTEPAFWAYALGKLGRALGQPLPAGAWDAALVLGVWGAVVFAALAVAWRVLVRRVALAQALQTGGAARQGAVALQRVALVALPVLAMVVVYLMLVAHGRANFRDAQVQSWLQIYQFGHLRFHFYWLTLALPWGLAMAAAWLLGGFGQPVPQQAAAAHAGRAALWGTGALALALLGLGAVRSVFDVTSHYRSSTEFRNTQWACIHAQWGTGQAVNCPTFDMPDATGALLRARDLGASFTRYLPMPVSPSELGRELHAWQGDALKRGEWRDVQWPSDHAAASAGHEADLGVALHTGQDAQWLPDVAAVTGLAQAMAQCRVLNVSVQLQAQAASAPARLQVFFQPQGEAGFSEANSVVRAWGEPPDAGPSSTPSASGGMAPVQTLHAVWESAQGFAPALRVDVSDRPMALRVLGVRVACRLPTLAAWQQAHANRLEQTP